MAVCFGTSSHLKKIRPELHLVKSIKRFRISALVLVAILPDQPREGKASCDEIGDPEATRRTSSQPVRQLATLSRRKLHVYGPSARTVPYSGFNGTYIIGVGSRSERSARMLGIMLINILDY